MNRSELLYQNFEKCECKAAEAERKGDIPEMKRWEKKAKDNLKLSEQAHNDSIERG